MTMQVPAVSETDPKQCTHWKTLDCPKSIETHLLQRNQKHFGQAAGAPFTVPPLSQEINFGASTAITDLILNGSCTHEDLVEMTEMLIEHLQQISPPATTSRITPEEFEAKIKT
jgi:hypothetical protein